MTPARDKKQAVAFGRRGEALAVLSLWLTGWRVRARHVRLAGGEIDIVAERGAVRAFIEVKARADEDTARHALGPAQRQRIIRAATAHLARFPLKPGQDARFDVIVIGGPWGGAWGRLWAWPRRIENAFRADGL